MVLLVVQQQVINPHHLVLDMGGMDMGGMDMGGMDMGAPPPPPPPPRGEMQPIGEPGLTARINI
jgi:hypothetical protein